MTALLDRLNLSPQERRLVVGVAIAVFIVLNIWLVIPYFGELSKIEQRTVDATKLLAKYNDEIRKEVLYKKEQTQLESQGNAILPEQQDVAFTREVDQQATVSGLNVVNSTILPSGGGGKTNTFFLEKVVQLNFQNSGEKELVEFLYNLGAANTLIRVRNMSLRPEQGRMKLGGQLTLVKSFQRKPPPKTPVAAASAKPTATNAPASKPAASNPPPAAAKPAETKKTDAPKTAPTPVRPKILSPKPPEPGAKPAEKK